MIIKKTKRLLLYSVLIICGILFVYTRSSNSSESNSVHIIQLDDATINPVTAEYIVRSIDRAYTEGAQCLIIKLDTPGGLLNSTRLIVKNILTAKIPVVVYISPSGSHAGSAGVFITYASHVAAMAPSTNIGAAHPVEIGGSRKGKEDIWEGLKELLDKSAAEKKEKEEKANEEEKTAKGKNETVQKKTVPKTAEHAEKNLNDQGLKEEKEEDSDPMSSKILEDTVAFIKAMAQERHRNVEWAIKSVTKSSAITETEALQLGVVEIIAQNDQELLEKLDGRVVKVNGQDVTLQTKNAAITNIPMNFRLRFLNVLVNPNIAYILMILGFWGLFYEVTHPGIAVPGVLGAIFMILAFYSLQTLPTNYAGVALIILGLLLFIAEAFTPGVGLLALGGTVCMLLGSLILFDTSLPMMRLSMSLVLTLTLSTAALTFFLIQAALRVHRRHPLGGQETLVGEKGDARTDLKPNKEGKVFVHGELWNATSDEEIKKNDKIIVHEIDGMILKVKKG